MSDKSDAVKPEMSSRAWQACQPCRRKKVKCDGKHPCRNCETRHQECVYPEARDLASTSRFYATTFEARCQKLDTLSEKLELVASQLSRAADALISQSQAPHSTPPFLGSDADQHHHPPVAAAAFDAQTAAAVLQSFPHSVAAVGGTARTDGRRVDAVAEIPAPVVLRGPAFDGALPGDHRHRLPDASMREAGGIAGGSGGGIVGGLAEMAGMDNDNDDDDDDDDDFSDSNMSLEKLADDAEPSVFDVESAAGQAAAMVTDSYGRLRFVGGATNRMLIDAAKSMSPTARTQTTVTPGSTIGSTAETDHLNHNQNHNHIHNHNHSPNSSSTVPPKDGDVELPLFVRGKTWPELPFLPKPEQLARPPQYVSDLLVGLYFDKLHYTFPILFKPHFMQRYAQMLRSGSSQHHASAAASPVDKEFLMVFFAVCACASGLLPRDMGMGMGASSSVDGGGTSAATDGGFPGFDYYEKALLLHYAASGQASLERVQCLGLLALCTASWNTLTQSWSLAGQAVRLSMDIGFHMNSRYMNPGVFRGSRMDSLDLLRQSIARRTWWSVFCLERVVSICLGRPTAVDEKDCCCELPLDLADEDLERHFQNLALHPGERLLPPPQQPPNAKLQTSSLTGFLAFARLCQIAVKIQQLSSPLRLRQLASRNSNASKKYLARVAALDASLREWLEALPDSVRFSANAIEQPAGGEAGLVMCLAHDPNRGAARAHDRMNGATAQCISAAKSCINAAELVRDLVPSSHYLALCVHYLTLSGVALLRMSKHPQDRSVVADAAMCAGLLKDLELRWSGAGRSRAIVEHLLAESVRQASVAGVGGVGGDNRKDAGTAGGAAVAAADALVQHSPSRGQKRPFVDFAADLDGEFDGMPWRDMLWTDLLDGSDLAALGSWNF